MNEKSRVPLIIDVVEEGNNWLCVFEILQNNLVQDGCDWN